MSCTISLGPADNILLTFPSGREVLLPATEFAGPFLLKLLKDEAAGRKGQRQYIGVFPTQAAIDRLAAGINLKKLEKRREWQKEYLAKRNINYDELDFTL